MNVLELARLAKAAAPFLGRADTRTKNRALEAAALALEKRAGEIYSANAEDLSAAAENGMKESLLDRLKLTEKRLQSAIEGMRGVAAQDDPVGGADGTTLRPNGLRIERRRVPLGVIGIIYEARPNVTVDAAALCLKSGNVCVLRGGKEAIRTNMVIAEIIREAIASVGLPRDCVTLVSDTSRESAAEMMRATGLLDVLIPRGGAGLIRSVVENAHVPVIQTGTGICHIYCDEGCDHKMAAQITANAKCSRPSVCNAAECLLVHSSEAETVLPMIYDAVSPWETTLRCDERAFAILGGKDRVQQAEASDFETEFLDYILAVKTVDSLEEALAEIAAHGTGHSETIITENYTRANLFLENVDAAAVYVNASTRFTDGGEFGLGAEIGISTQKLHARGPMGLKALTTVKYAIYGNGQVR